MKSQLIYGDSLKILPTLPKEHFQLLLTDPPYCVSRVNNFSTMNRQGVDFGEWDKEFDQISWLEHALPLLKPGASIVIWNDWKKLGKIANFLEKNGVSVKRLLTWHKTNPMPANCKYMFLQATEHAIWAVKKPRGKQKKIYNGGYHHGVFSYSVVQDKVHTTKKPDAMFKEIVEILTNKDDWVLDPFAGAGTTAFAAKKTGRNHVSIEIDEMYHEYAMKRWSAANV